MRAEDLVIFLESRGIGVPGQDIFFGKVPESPDNTITIIPAGGPAPDQYLPQADPVYHFHIRSVTFSDAEARAKEVALLFLDETGRLLHNFSIGSKHVHYIRFLQEPTSAFIGFDQNGRAEFRFSVQFHIRRN